MLLPLQLFGLGLYLVVVLWCIVAIILAVWVYSDAEKRGMEAALWMIIVLLTGIIGLIIYLIVRE
ncbi:MAG: PLDc N-terminal domain-containing protein [Candidatus Jordarchaeales archaeon]|nr:PLDc N-terminal domain-containing protein [Candidatus Jordarchaeia archaeon]